MSTKLRSTPLKSCNNYVKELEEILSSLEHLLSHGKELGLKVAGRNRSRRPERHTPVTDASDFCGREDIKETIIQSLRSADVRGDKVSVIPVIGAGGLGKTTLVQIIYDNPEVEQLFGKVRAWVTISTEFDLPAIIKNIIVQVTGSSQIDGNVDHMVLQFKLRDALKGKRFLLVLDDVWSEVSDGWKILKSCLQSGERGSKIIVTTRSEKVASIMAPNSQHYFLRQLPEKDCLKLFAQTVFDDDVDRDADPDLQKLGEKIVRKCKGYPLSVVTVGGILRGERDPEKWEKILENSLWELLQKDSEDIIPSLWLSYLYLPSQIKPCFAYCSIFPKDYLFKREVVVQLWMAEGFLQNEAGKRGITMEEVGKRYFKELISRSLFQSSKTRYGAQCFIMHDLVHDLAMNVSGEFCFCLEGEKNLRDLLCKTRYLSCNMAIEDVKTFEGLSKAKRLHSFVGLQPSFQAGGDIPNGLEELVMEGGCLRVLSLSLPSDYTIGSLPDSIGDLKHLRYLNLSWTGLEKLSDSVGTLYNLQTLLLSYCKHLTQLPDSIGNLKHMRYLNLSDSAVEELPDSVGTLYDLQTLLLSNCYKLTQLPDSIGNLRDLRDLNLSWTAVEKLPDSVGTIYNLQTLLLSCCFLLTQLPDSIGNLKHLRDLDLSGSAVEKLPDSIGNLKHMGDLNLSWTAVKKLPDSIGTLYSLQMLLLSNCSKLTQLPDSIGNLKHLRDLNLSDSGVKKVPDSVGTLCDLQALLLSNCSKLTQLPDSIGSLKHLTDLNLSGSAVEKLPDSVGTLCDLQALLLSNCSKLTQLPDSIGNLNHLRDLNLSGSAVEKLPDSIGTLCDLQVLLLSNCSKLTQLPSLGRLSSLKELKMKGFHKLETIDEFYGNDSPFKSLEVLHFSNMPEWKRWSVIEVPRLKELKLEGCPKLVGGLPNCKTLTTLVIDSCPKLEYSGNQCRYPSLESLEIRQSCCYIRRFSLELLTKLNKLVLTELDWLVELTGESSNELKSLFIEKCPKLEFLGNSRYGSLKNLHIRNCEALKSIPLDYFPKLNELTLRYCPNFESFRFGEGGLPSNLESLEIWGCKKLAAQVMHWDLQTHTPCLKELDIDGCGEELLDSFPPEGLLPTSITCLCISGFRRLKTLNIHAFQHLKELYVFGCDELQCLPEESLPNSLSVLQIRDCPLLERRYQKETGEGWHKISHIPYVWII